MKKSVEHDVADDEADDEDHEVDDDGLVAEPVAREVDLGHLDVRLFEMRHRDVRDLNVWGLEMWLLDVWQRDMRRLKVRLPDGGRRRHLRQPALKIGRAHV